jgi:uncharacterized protein (TIGR00730 family)
MPHRAPATVPLVTTEPTEDRTVSSVCVYCASSTGTNPAIVDATRELGALLASEGIELVYGGGAVGLMGQLADTVLAAGGRVTGIMPTGLFPREVGHRGLSEFVEVESMHERKARMADAADGFIALPGGIGTLEELFEMFTWLQLGFHDKPVGILDVDGFFAQLLGFLDDLVTRGFLHRAHRESLLVDEDPGRLMERMAVFTSPQLGRWWPAPERKDPV